MPGVTEQEIAQAKQMNLYQYMQLCEPDNFKPEGPGQFRHKGHSSLTFAEDGSWTYFKTKATGRTALNYLIAVEGVSFVEAVREINRIQGGVRPSFQPVKAPSPPAEKKPAKEFRLPKPDKNNYAATAYLRKRCIHPNVLTVCKQKRILYQTSFKDHPNCVFVGRDGNGEAKGGSLRGCSQIQFRRDIPGSKKIYPFYIEAAATADTVEVYEAPIDAMSGASLKIIQHTGNWRGVHYALKNGKMQITEDAEITLLDRYQKLTIQYPEVCTAAVKLSSRQILSAGKNGLVLQAHDDNGNPAKLMVNKSEVTTSPDGEITFNVGNDFSYDLVYEDETHGTIRGAKLIQQIDEENHVEPVQVILSENQIKAMSIRGVTIHLPQNGIERLFIPEKYVLRDLDAGQCTVLLYPNQQYSYVPIGDSKKRLNIQGDRLSEFLGSSINPITESTGLKRKIAAVERRAGIENAKFLGKMLQGMADSRIHTTGDYDKVIHDLGKTRIGLTNELAEVKQKRTTYAAAAKHLQICRTYKSVWMEYVAKPLNQKTGYFNQHSMELQVYRTAAAKLEKEGIDQSVEIDKVNNFAQILESKINDLAEQLREIDLQEQDYRRERETLTAIQADLCE